MKSHASASSQPPPSAKPLTAAIDRHAQRLQHVAHAVAALGEARARSSPVQLRHPAMSAPATNAFSPAPVRIDAADARVAVDRVAAPAISSSSVVPLSALSALGG